MRAGGGSSKFVVTAGAGERYISEGVGVVCGELRADLVVCIEQYSGNLIKKSVLAGSNQSILIWC